ncbi:putative reverse transcriptase domain, reverse transcriptase zinc-binding domain protein [Tanacetum coccineum]
MHNYHRDGSPPRCAFKVDIQKAYDTVDWEFLGLILKCFGFHPTMVQWIMACVTSTFFSLSLNGVIHGYFKGRRGLRQGDPISPYLFTLVMEVLTLIIQRRVRLSDSFCYHNHCEELQIINVCFADDLFIFARGEVESARLIMDSLDEFKRTSGLVPSIPKSTAYFCNVRNHIKIAILSIMPFFEGELPVKYLGVPLISSRLLNKDCIILVKKAKNRIGDWKNKSLSFAGRLQLYYQTLPPHTLGKLPPNPRPQSALPGTTSPRPTPSHYICLPIRDGGLGIRNLKIFNISLMTTHIWNIVSNKESLWVRWIHMYKLKGRTIWDIPLKADMSWGWLKLLQLRDIVKPFFWTKLGNGNDTSLWYDTWCSHCPLIGYLSPRDIMREGFNLQNCVADLVSQDGWMWPQSWLLKAPDLGMVPVPTLEESRSDVPQWRDLTSKCSSFSVRCAWEALRPRGPEVWQYVRPLAGMEMVPPSSRDILMHLQPMAHRRTAKSVIGRLIFAATSYFIWLERNNRMFKNERRSSEELRDIIMVTVRLNLLTLRFKNTTMVTLLSRWKMPKTFRLYG